MVKVQSSLIKNKNTDEEVKLEKEVVISTWINELELNLKTYDIVSFNRNPADYTCEPQNIHNETFNVLKDTYSIEVSKNTRSRMKTMQCK